MLDLLDCNNKGPQASNTTTAEDVLRSLQSEAVDEAVRTGTIIVPEFTLHANAQYEANQHNIINQALIGAKEGVVKALTTFVGKKIINTVLPCTDGDYKGLEKYTLPGMTRDAINQLIGIFKVQAEKEKDAVIAQRVAKERALAGRVHNERAATPAPTEDIRFEVENYPDVDIGNMSRNRVITQVEHDVHAVPAANTQQQ